MAGLWVDVWTQSMPNTKRHFLLTLSRLLFLGGNWIIYPVKMSTSWCACEQRRSVCSTSSDMFTCHGVTHSAQNEDITRKFCVTICILIRMFNFRNCWMNLDLRKMYFFSHNLLVMSYMNVVSNGDPQILGSRSPWPLHFVRWRLIFVDSEYSDVLQATVVSPGIAKWRLDFRKICTGIEHHKFSWYKTYTAKIYSSMIYSRLKFLVHLSDIRRNAC